MYRIAKRFRFSASHVLTGLPQTHPCTRLHGHNYEVELIFQSDKLDETGFVRDYRSLDQVKKFIAEQIDHRHLNDLFPFPPTAENLARFFYEALRELYPELISVRVAETQDTWATYEANPS